jgi:hypothetical protein
MLNNEKNKFFQQCGCIKYNRRPAIDYTERSRKQLDSIGYLPKHRNGIPFPVGGTPLCGGAVQPLTQSRFLSIFIPGNPFCATGCGTNYYVIVLAFNHF